MNVQQPDHNTFRELLYLEPDGELNAGERSRLQQHLAACATCREERRELAALDRVMRRSAIEVDDSFTREVMEGLPPTGWETRSPRTWWFALVAVLLLVVASGWLIGEAGKEAAADLPLAAASAIWDFASASVLAGSGLLAASWKGLGIAIQEILGRSVWNLLAFGVLVFCLDFILLRLLLRGRTTAARADAKRRS